MMRAKEVREWLESLQPMIAVLLWLPSARQDEAYLEVGGGGVPLDADGWEGE